MTTDIYIYLFESKSIQSYLTRTSKLRDIVRISDKLDSLIDNDQNSILSIVLNELNYTNNLKDLENLENLKNDSNNISSEHDIIFFRCKGGTFYCYSKDEQKIRTFKETWSLTFQQLMPGMAFCESLKKGTITQFIDTLEDAIKNLALSINTPTLPLPYATAICQSYPRTGSVAIKNEIPGDYEDGSCDLATLRNETNFNTTRDIYCKFFGITNEEYQLNLVNGHIDVQEIKNYFNERQDDDKADNDIALIHLDGNGIGQTLIKLKDKLKENLQTNSTNNDVSTKNVNEFVNAMQSFSCGLCKTTQESVKFAIIETIKQFHTDSKYKNPNKFLFRPLVLGGDDVTLLIDAKYAAKFTELYCDKFKDLSKDNLKETSNRIKNNTQTNLSLSASGGILFNKINHPYNNSARIIEELAKRAKVLTKQNLAEKKKNDPNTLECGEAAISFFRMSSATDEKIDDVISRSRIFDVVINDQSIKFSTGTGTYYVASPNTINKENNEIDNLTNLNSLKSLIDYIDKLKNSTNENMHSCYRNMLTEISHNNFAEANKIFERWQKVKNNYSLKSWYSKSDNNKNYEFETNIDDILVLYHYMNKNGDK